MAKTSSAASLRLTLRAWLPLVVVVVGLVAFGYVAVQQNYRQSANDPQLQLASDAATLIKNGAEPAAVVPAARVDLASSLAPFMLIGDGSGRLVAGNGWLAGSTPLPPAGVFADTLRSGSRSFTWQTAAGARFAAVAEPAGDDVVVVARSLAPTEQRIGRLTVMAALALIGLLVATLGAVMLARGVAPVGR
ncbi:MAG TPA: hypothetical protein VLI05_02540 [Candidatus Saccharimonadia bacterium]|nr:hypothetical protein [Candidatus Saccharimonadia bacterium]